ncbi:MAG: alpha/beta fold hydrolase [Acetobacteraceae bacterium]|nr:alpha/beta fold hydrolase [Acetobacteraceae bacterium]
MDWIDINGVGLRYEISGAGPKTLVLVHEMGGSLESWDQVMPALQPGRRILRYDWRGAGMSEKARGKLDFDLMAEDLAALLDAKGLVQKIAIVGCAVGAGISLRFTCRFPTRVGAVVAMAPATGVTPDRIEATQARILRMEREGPRALVEEAFAASYPPEVRHSAEEFRTFRARWLGNDPNSYAMINRMLLDTRIEDGFGKIVCPTLVLAGRHDKARPPEAVEGVAKLIPHADYRVVDSGHFMAVQTPQLIAETINGFLAPEGY